MCILLKLDYAKFGVSNLSFSKVIEEKPFLAGSVRPPPAPLVKEGLISRMKTTGVFRMFWIYIEDKSDQQLNMYHQRMLRV